MNHHLRILLASVVLFMASLSFAQPPQSVQTQFDIMLRSVKDNVYASFISAGTEEFKAGYVQNSFDLVREYIAARLAKGYEANYLGTLNLNGYAVFLWKLTYTDGGDDSLVSLSAQNGYVAGFLIQ